VTIVFLTTGISRFGFLTDKIRRLVWPKLARVDVIESSPRPDEDTMKNHKSYTQVTLDVARSIKRFPPSIEEEQRIALQDKLIKLIMRILIKNPNFYYYQGYHDICITFLLILGEENAFHVVDAISKSHLELFMNKTIDKTIDVMDYIFIIIHKECPELRAFLDKSEVGNIFALSWIITWFSHVLQNFKVVGRLFDLFLASHSLLPIYLTSAIVLHKKEAILELDCDVATVHLFLNQIVESEESLPFEDLIIKAKELCLTYPVKELKILQQEEKKKRLWMNQKNMSLIYRLINILQTGSQYGFFSITLIMVFCAIVYQQLHK